MNGRFGAAVGDAAPSTMSKSMTTHYWTDWLCCVLSIGIDDSYYDDTELN